MRVSSKLLTCFQTDSSQLHESPLRLTSSGLTGSTKAARLGFGEQYVPASTWAARNLVCWSTVAHDGVKVEDVMDGFPALFSR
ncbi:hypothetical protein CORC01_07553 [Colletotrichum orchidophilum]|uniref:Uncharacterized protein n=1 Tax=Colletotrichum orchidophilum TaxID=1209926 RepID=A0A1G4B757_9PEZI|nr:uncharacterized protein CORC01_07553 [Colletotrichum orchidophilum]OHE97112.1 hypothetical protein CORC01_07553 [Colletotrichum orchidophilum]